MDVHSKAQRRFNMSCIRGRDTKPEMIIRKWLWSNGFRYRLCRRDLPGKPDIVLPKYHVVIFVHGCFWHRHGCRFTSTPATNTDHWRRRFEENVARDKSQVEILKKNGWRVAIVWECTLKGKRAFPENEAKTLYYWLTAMNKNTELVIG